MTTKKQKLNTSADVVVVNSENVPPVSKKPRVTFKQASVEDFQHEESPSVKKTSILKNKLRKNVVAQKSTNENIDSNKAAGEILTRKEAREKFRNLKSVRRPNYALSMKAKEIWEKLRSKKLNEFEREKLIQELYSLVEGKSKTLIFAHDTVRIFQCLLALKNQEIISKLFEELKDDVIEMSKKKYSKFFVEKMFKYGSPAQREIILQKFYKNVVQLAKHSVACDVLEYAYNQHANGLQRARILSEFYLAEFQLFKIEHPMNLQQILVQQPEKRQQIQQNLFDNLTGLIDKPALRHSFVHFLLKEYIESFSDQSGVEILMDNIKDKLPLILHTKDGAFCSMECIWRTSTKQRKILIKSLKSLVLKACKEEHGHQILMALFDTVDDTALVNKIILHEIKENLAEILNDKHGVRIMLYLLNCKDKQHFGVKFIDFMSQGRAKSVHSKKSDSQRRSELIEEISGDLIDFAAQNVGKIFMESDSHFPLLLASIVEHCLGDKTSIFEAIADLMVEEFVPCNMEKTHVIEHNRGHYLLIRLLKNDKILNGKGETTLSEILIQKLNDDNFESWLTCNKGCFVLANMFDGGVKKVQQRISTCVERRRKKLNSYGYAGAKILLQKVV